MTKPAARKSQLAIALDCLSREELFESAESFRGLPVVLKLGLRTLPMLLPKDVSELRKLGFQVFVDVKLHDIPTQVRDSVGTWGRLGADFVTVHLSGGPEMLRMAQAEARNAPQELRLLGVSVLTSLSQDDLVKIGFEKALPTQVEQLVGLGLDADLNSFVCSLHEVARLRALAQSRKLPDPFFVCPGLVMAGEKANADQQRTATIEEALEQRVGMLVVGRSILKDPNPRLKAERILDLIDKAALRSV